MYISQVHQGLGRYAHDVIDGEALCLCEKITDTLILFKRSDQTRLAGTTSTEEPSDFFAYHAPLLSVFSSIILLQQSLYSDSSFVTVGAFILQLRTSLGLKTCDTPEKSSC